MRVLEPDMPPGFPHNQEHRKSWEWAHTLLGLEKLRALNPDGVALGVAAGNETLLFELTRHMRWVFATDIYGSGTFNHYEAQGTMLVDPDRFARGPYNRNRLVVQYMNALDLRYEEATFDVVFCLSSMEHFGGMNGAKQGLAEMARVLKPNGILAITTECIVNNAPHLTSSPNLELFSPETLQDLLTSSAHLQMIEEFDHTITPLTLATCISLKKAVEDSRIGRGEFPHIVLELEGRQFTSGAAFLRKFPSTSRGD
jgi:SAM-dependent methyltransferase